MKSHDLIVGEPGLEPGISNTKNLRVTLNLNYDIVSNRIVTRKLLFHYSPKMPVYSRLSLNQAVSHIN